MTVRAAKLSLEVFNLTLSAFTATNLEPTCSDFGGCLKVPSTQAEKRGRREVKDQLQNNKSDKYTEGQHKRH